MSTNVQAVNSERPMRVASGWVYLPIAIILLIGAPALLIYSIVIGTAQQGPPVWGMFIPALLVLILAVIMLFGFFTLQPNEARVCVLFGAYVGTVRDSGFHWGNPFYSNGQATTHMAEAIAGAESGGHGRGARQGQSNTKKTWSRNKISLRVRNFNSDRLKVNDKRGNPIEIGAVVVWRVDDTAQAMFDVDDYESYVSVQSESALRHLASQYAYDYGEDNEVTLRSGLDEVSQALRIELQERLHKAGVVVEEARLTHLAYAPEIAQLMLRRQQAEAIIAARQKIVQGAVSMVDMALKDLAQRQVVQLDDERKAAMVSNLMVVLCGESEVHPIVNTGTLYT